LTCGLSRAMRNPSPGRAAPSIAYPRRNGYVCIMLRILPPRISKTLSRLRGSTSVPLKAPTVLLPLLITLLFSACARSDRHVSEEYVGRSLAGKTMAVLLPDSSHVEVGNPADVWACFHREKSLSAQTLFAQEFRDGFLAGLDRYLDFAKPVAVEDNVPAAPDSQRVIFARPKSMDLPAFTYALPTRAYLAAHGTEAELALLVGRVKASTRRNDLVAPKLGGTLQQDYLFLEGDYIIWDYAGNKPIGYGRFRSETEYQYELKTKDWMAAFDKVVKLVIDASPFKGPKWFRS